MKERKKSVKFLDPIHQPQPSLPCFVLLSKLDPNASFSGVLGYRSVTKTNDNASKQTQNTLKGSFLSLQATSTLNHKTESNTYLKESQKNKRHIENTVPKHLLENSWHYKSLEKKATMLGWHYNKRGISTKCWQEVGRQHPLVFIMSTA